METGGTTLLGFRVERVTGIGSQTGTLLDEVEAQSGGQSTGQSSTVAMVTSQTRTGTSLPSPTGFEGQGSEIRRLNFDSDAADFQLERISSRKAPGKMPTKLLKKLEMNQKYTKKEGGVWNLYYFTDMFDLYIKFRKALYFFFNFKFIMPKFTSGLNNCPHSKTYLPCIFV